MLNLDQLETVDTINARADYDLRYSGKTGKFTLGQDAYTTHNMDDNGFVLLRDKSSNTPVLQLVPNDQANVHPGREDADQKGKTFTAKALKNMLNLGEDSVEFTFNVETANGNTYITLESDVLSNVDDAVAEDDGDSIATSDDVIADSHEQEDVPTASENEEANSNWG